MIVACSVQPNIGLMEDRTYLDTSDGMALYAERHGAKLDRVSRRWYVEGEVPAELQGLIPKQPNKPKHIVAPSCPKCGFHMVLRTSKTGQQFWGCSQFKNNGCKGNIALEDHLDSLESERLKSALDYIKSDAPPAHNAVSAPSSLKSEIERVVTLAAQIRGGVRQAERWLSTPKVALKGKTPAQLMATVKGCQQVERLLLATQD